MGHVYGRLAPKLTRSRRQTILPWWSVTPSDTKLINALNRKIGRMHDEIEKHMHETWEAQKAAQVAEQQRNEAEDRLRTIKRFLSITLGTSADILDFELIQTVNSERQKRKLAEQKSRELSRTIADLLNEE
jgi:hypothetical protein